MLIESFDEGGTGDILASLAVAGGFTGSFRFFREGKPGFGDYPPGGAGNSIKRLWERRGSPASTLWILNRSLVVVT